MGLHEVNAGGAKEEKLLDPIFERRMDNVQLDHKILVEKLCRMEFVGEDAAYFRRGHEIACGLSAAIHCSTATLD